jgi:hypothetical protein
MIFTISEMYFVTIRQDNTFELSDIRLNCQSFESKRSYGVVIIWRLGKCSQANGDTYAKAKCPLG